MFSVSEYLQHIEDASSEIQQQKEPVDRTIILWWGVDGLRMNEDGSFEWISRRKKELEPVQITPCVTQYPKEEPEPVNQNVFYQPPQSIVPLNHPFASQINMCQSTRAQIDALQMQISAIQTENLMQRHQAQMIAQMQLYPNYQPPYFYSSLTGCCCDGSILR